MLTLDQAKALKHGEILVDSQGRRWKVNGQVKRWVRDEDRICVPLKHGLYAYDYLDNSMFVWDGQACTNLTLESEIVNA